MPPLHSSKGRRAFKGQNFAKSLHLCCFNYPTDCSTAQPVFGWVIIFVMASAGNPPFLFKAWTAWSEMVLRDITKKKRMNGNKKLFLALLCGER